MKRDEGIDAVGDEAVETEATGVVGELSAPDGDAEAGAWTTGSAEEAKEALANEEMLYELSDLFRIFADTTRLKVLYAMMAGDFSVSDLAEIVGVSQSAISHQLRTLKQARLVKFTRKGKNVHYSLCDDHVKTILDMGINHICE